MSSIDNRFRKKWQDYGGHKATTAEHDFYKVFEKLFEDTEYKIERQPTLFNKIYVNVPLSPKDEYEIYHPDVPVTKHGIQPDAMLTNTKTGKSIFVELKRQDGWVEGKPRSAGRGNAHERLCKYFTPGLLKIMKRASHIEEPHYPFWIVFQGDITKDPCRVREITLWFDDNKENYFFWRDTSDATPLIEHFDRFIAPLLE